MKRGMQCVRGGGAAQGLFKILRPQGLFQNLINVMNQTASGFGKSVLGDMYQALRSW